MKKIIFILCVSMLFSTQADAQAWLKKLGKTAENAAKHAVERRVERTANEVTNQAMDKAEDSVKGETEQDKSQTEGKDAVNNDVNTGKKNKDGGVSLASYSKYDFIPGEKVIFFEDFSQDAIGDFPALWNTNGSAEVVTTNLYPGNWMKFVMHQCIWTDALLNLPDNYTIEFDVININGKKGEGMEGYYFELMEAKNKKAWDGGSAPGEGGFQFRVAYTGVLTYHTWFYKKECRELNVSGSCNDDNLKQKMNQKYHIAIWVQKSRIRLYQNENKLIDLPKAFPTDCLKPDRIRFEEGSVMVSNIRVAVGAPDTRNKLMTEGKLVTYGIYFDVNKDVVKPESYGTLKDIAAVLNEAPDMKVKIVGHTDSDGDDAKNMDLSKRRAESVKAELVKSFGVNGDRLVTDGAGETQPVAKNDTPVNKALNRRVEFIKVN